MNVSRVNMDVLLGETWVLGPIACRDASGNALDSAPVSLRIASVDGVVLDAAAVTAFDGTITFTLPASEETNIAPALYSYEVRVFPADGSSYSEQGGTWNVRPSLYNSFPFTDQFPGGPPGPPPSTPLLNCAIVQTSNAELEAGVRYAVDTTTAVTLTLPAIADLAPGSMIMVADLTGLAGTNPITIEPFGEDLINGLPNNPIVDTRPSSAITFVVNAGSLSWEVIS